MCHSYQFGVGSQIAGVQIQIRVAVVSENSSLFALLSTRQAHHDDIHPCTPSNRVVFHHLLLRCRELCWPKKMGVCCICSCVCRLLNRAQCRVQVNKATLFNRVYMSKVSCIRRRLCDGVDC